MGSAPDFEQAWQLAGHLEHPDWSRYTGYLQLRGQGRRRAALQTLVGFVSVAGTWSFPQRWEFTAALLRQMDAPLPGVALPHPLVAEVLRPTLKEALDCFPHSPEPAYWLGESGLFAWEPSASGEDQKLAWFAEALRRDPGFQPAILAFVRTCLDRIGFAQHELPWGYLGQPSRDLHDLAAARVVLRGAQETAAAQRLWQQLLEAERVAHQYLRFQASGEGSYWEWCDRQSLSYR